MLIVAFNAISYFAFQRKRTRADVAIVFVDGTEDARCLAQPIHAKEVFVPKKLENLAAVLAVYSEEAVICNTSRTIDGVKIHGVTLEKGCTVGMTEAVQYLHRCLEFGDVVASYEKPGWAGQQTGLLTTPSLARRGFQAWFFGHPRSAKGVRSAGVICHYDPRTVGAPFYRPAMSQWIRPVMQAHTTTWPPAKVKADVTPEPQAQTAPPEQI